MTTFSLSDFYPCGSYKITKNAEESMGCTLYKNMSPMGVNRTRLEKLYSQGYIDSGQKISGVIEKFVNLRDNNLDIIVLLIIIFIFILIRKI